jgi:serine/threonine protein kinase
LSSHDPQGPQQDATDVGASRSSGAGDAATLAAGTAVGNHRIDEVLGRGGMGIVYRATDTRLNRAVAIKFLSIELADAQAKRRFEQEAQTASGLNHPHIVAVHDVGEHDGRQYIVSELVDGGTLDDWATANPRRTWRQNVELLTGVASALAAAHSAGVLHRDVKPGNILIGRNGYAKLGDFGLAKLVDTRADTSPRGETRNTRAGVVVGAARARAHDDERGHRAAAGSAALAVCSRAASSEAHVPGALPARGGFFARSAFAAALALRGRLGTNARNRRELSTVMRFSVASSAPAALSFGRNAVIGRP